MLIGISYVKYLQNRYDNVIFMRIWTCYVMRFPYDQNHGSWSTVDVKIIEKYSINTRKVRLCKE